VPDDAPLFFWYFFPFARNVVAWEATTGTGRATYFFRADPPVEPAVARLTRGLALFNFRREPIYLPDTSLDQQPRFQRYAIGGAHTPRPARPARRLPGTCDSFLSGNLVLPSTIDDRRAVS
jgi:hypothetical protein